MKTLAIGRPLVNFQKKPLQDPAKEGDDKTIYLRDYLIQTVGTLFQAENKERAILAYKVAQKLYDCNDLSVDLEDAEFKLVEDSVEKPRQGTAVLVTGQVYLMLDEAKRKAEELEEEQKESKQKNKQRE